MVAGSGGRHVEESSGLVFVLKPFDRLERDPTQRPTGTGHSLGRVVGRAVFQWPDERPEPRGERDPAPDHVVLAVQIRDDDDRKFEPLGLMNRHESDARSFLLGGRRLFFSRRVAEVGAQAGDEIGEGEPAARVVPPRQAHELPRVGSFPSSERLAGERCLEARFVENAVYQLGDRAAVLEVAPAREQNSGAVRAGAVEGMQRVVPVGYREAPSQVAPAGGMKPEEGFVGQSEEGAAQGAGERRRVQRVFDDGEHVDEVFDLLLGIKRLAADHVVIEPLGVERLFVGGQIGQRAKEEGDVTRMGGPDGLRRAVADRPAGVEPRADQAGEPAGLDVSPRVGVGLRGFPALLRVLGRLVGPDEFHRRAVGGGGGVGAGNESRGVVGERLREQRIHKIDDAGRAAEILGQGVAAGGRNFGSDVLKDFRLRAPEAINRLLVIADHEEAARGELRAAQMPEDLGLHRVGVLEFIDEHEPDACARPGAQQVAGLDQQVVEVEPAPRALGRFVGAPRLRRESRVPQARLRRAAGRRLVFLVPFEEPVNRSAQGLEHIFTHLVDLGRRPVRRLQSRRHLGEFSERGEPLARRRRLDAVKLEKEFALKSDQFLMTEFLCAQPLSATRGGALDGAKQDRASLLRPRQSPALDQFVAGFPLPLIEPVGKPTSDEGLQPAAHLAKPELDGQLDQVLVLVGEPAPELPRQSVVEKRGGNGFVEDLEIRVEPRAQGMSAEQAGAMFVEGADRRGFEPAQDRAPALHLLGPARSFEPSLTLPTDPLAQFPRGLFRECQSDQGRQRTAALKFTEEPGCEDGRLAAARPGAQGDARPLDLERSALLIGQFRRARVTQGALRPVATVFWTRRTCPIRQTRAKSQVRSQSSFWG